MEQQQNDDLAWNARRGNAWADLQPMLDRLFLPFEQILADAIPTNRGCHVLDIGCGTGATTLAIAKRLATRGGCTGLDVSGVLLEIARRRAIAEGTTNAHFILGDAQRYRFAPNTFDAVASRFGVMFFDHPEAAFANIRSAVRPGGTLACVVWRSRDDNAFMAAAERAAEPLLGRSDRPDPNAPGQFAFADANRVRGILSTAGWDAIKISPLDVPCTLSKPDLAIYARRMGRIGMILPDLDEALRAKVTAALDDAFASFLLDDIARFDVACWMVQAHAG